MHQLNLKDIQTEALRLLTCSQEIVTELLESDLISEEETNQKQTLAGDFLEEQRKLLINEHQKTKQMEMVVAVVGTMKAGKSTTINAIVGQEVLPNRSLPMTALPTLVSHKAAQKSPLLTLNHKQPLITLSQEINAQIKQLPADANRAFIDSPDGKMLVNEINQHGQLNIKTEYYGQDEIFVFLKKINDLMRLAREINIAPPYDEYSSMDHLPRIEVEFFHLKNKQGDNLGRLSILDTPGPNEFGQSDALKNVFRQQLKQASAVLLAMDYTQLNSEADGGVRQEVDKIKQMLGERLFILVNKFDNANKNTMDKDETKQYVANTLMNKDVSPDRVYPVSSWWGFLANQALNTLSEGQLLSIDEPWVKDFGEEALGRRWQHKLDDSEEISAAAEELWKDSNFNEPLEKVITEAHTKAAYDSLNSALHKLENILNELNKGVNGRKTVLKYRYITDALNYSRITARSRKP